MSGDASEPVTNPGGPVERAIETTRHNYHYDEDGDVRLISSDNVVFRVHKRQLARSRYIYHPLQIQNVKAHSTLPR